MRSDVSDRRVTGLGAVVAAMALAALPGCGAGGPGVELGTAVSAESAHDRTTGSWNMAGESDTTGGTTESRWVNTIPRFLAGTLDTPAVQVLALQEAGNQPAPGASPTPRVFPNPGVTEFTWYTGGTTPGDYRIYWSDTGMRGDGLAIVSRETAVNAVQLAVHSDIQARPMMGVQFGTSWYFTAHARANGANNHNDAADIVETARQFMAARAPGEDWMVLADFNQNPARMDVRIQNHMVRPHRPTQDGGNELDWAYDSAGNDTTVNAEIYYGNSDHRYVRYAVNPGCSGGLAERTAAGCAPVPGETYRFFSASLGVAAIKGLRVDTPTGDVTEEIQVRFGFSPGTSLLRYFDDTCLLRRYGDLFTTVTRAPCGTEPNLNMEWGFDHGQITVPGAFNVTLHPSPDAVGATLAFGDGSYPWRPSQGNILPPRSLHEPGADPSVIRVGQTYYSVDVRSGGIYVRTAASSPDLIHAEAVLIWADPGIGEIWAPELMRIAGRYYVYFSGGPGAAHRMYVISSASPTSGYGAAQKLALPDDKWAIDGTAFNFNNQLWFVWSGWAGDTNIEQNLYIARMTNPTTPTGARYIISQAREPWERVVGNPFINEGPEAIKDPNGQLHIVYSANGSWSDQYCLGDLRLRAGGDPTYVWDWYKSNGCLFGSNLGTMMPGYGTTQSVNGPGHHSFVLLDGDINTSPPAGARFPLMYHAVAKGTPYSWDNRRWHAGSFGWWPNISYSRKNVPGDNINTGYSLGFFEDRDGPLPPPPATGAPGQTSIRNQDPSVLRVDATYYSVESDGGNIYSRSASNVSGLAGSPRTLIWSAPKNMPNVWAPELVRMPAALGSWVYAIYFASGDGGAGQRMYYTWSNSPDRNFSNPMRLALPDDKWAVDGTAFNFNSQLWFVWSGWEGNTNVEQNLYIARMNSPSEVTGKRYIISQAREGWERVVGNPFINEAPAAIKDPSGQLHIVYSANGSWSDQYCLADLRLRAGGDPTYVWDWYKSNGCLFGSNRNTMMAGWDPTLFANGPGSHSFVLLYGDIATSPPAGPRFPLMFHGVPKGVDYKWENRLWYFGSFCWWGNTTYSRQNVPGDNNNTGWSLKFFE